jgi:acyl-CoA hydrolase
MSLALHAGATVEELHRAAADPDRVVIVESNAQLPRTIGLPPQFNHSLHVDEVDVIVHTDVAPFVLADPPATGVEKAIAELARTFVPDGATLQTGIGGIPSSVVSLLAEGGGGDYGVHSEMFTTGLMQLHRAGKVTNTRKGIFNGFSVTTFALGSAELYTWLDGNADVRFLPVDIVNAPHTIGRNSNMMSINGALAIDLYGQVVADRIAGRQYSGIGGHEDFVSSSALSLDSRSIICMPSTALVGGVRRSRIVPWFGAGTVITTPRHQVDVVITEYGIAELQGHTVHQRGEALAAVAHPDFRDQLADAAERASGGESPVPPANR